ncbi:olfactory receptor 2L3 [Camelus ferus]|nr:olfactory receptor 2L3 [Camelus ferus]
MDSFLFVAIAILFSVALMGNITLILLIRLDPRLHTPMYFLLSQLSFIDMMYISTTVPKMAVNFLSNSKTISFLGCEIQTFVFLVLGGTEALLLGFMSYDRYVAICHPLRYPVLMSKRICWFLVTLALFGNLSMILLICLDTHLHTPMYFLLSQLSLMDLTYISTTVPKMASNFLFGNKSIFFIGCGIQSFFFLTLAGAEGLLLVSMAYDRYVAICFPLHYPIRMSKRMYVLMITGSWIMGSINSCAHTTYALHIPYCRSRAINHFFCDVPAMLTLTCMDTWVYEYTVFVSTSLFLLLPFTGIACSYGRVLLAVYRMRSAEGRKRAYSTCSATSLW